ncbi:MAG: hypothetical protein ACOX6Z_05510 [Dethiobacteria bacterium]
MQIVHNFNISPREYLQRGKENNFPSINICPCCAYPSTLPKHGFYWRNVSVKDKRIRRSRNSGE